MGTSITLLAGWMIMAAPSIEIRQAEVSFPEPHVVRLQVAATGEGVEVGSYGMRTADKDAPPPPGFRSRGDYAFLAAADVDDEHWHLFFDDRRGDDDPTEGAVAMTIDVSAWDDGVYRFMLFACNRPAGGDYVQDTRRVRIEVRDGEAVQPATCMLEALKATITEFSVSPERVEAGEAVQIRATVDANEPGQVRWQLTVPFWIEEDETPPGFRYDREEQKAYLSGNAGFEDNGPLDDDPAEGSILLTIPTDGWERARIYNLTLRVTADFAPEHAMAWRDLAITVKPERPKFEISLEHDQELRPGTYFGNIVATGDGSARAYNYLTEDGGRTWEEQDQRGISLSSRLSDGTIMGMGFRTEPIEGRPGYYRNNLYLSHDGGRTVEGPIECEIHVPQATSGVGHAFAAGPLFHRSIVDLPDGSLLAIFYGWFEGDESPVPGQPDSFRYRTWVMRSEDRGRHWEYLSTVGYDPEIGTEGYCEAVLRRLPNGELVSLLRTGGDNRPYHLDNPLCVAWSDDGGRSWAGPIRTGFEGVSPDLAVMSDGTLACSTGRPGSWLLFSTDNGRTWGDPFSIDPTRYSGYTGLTEVEPGVLLYGYGVRAWLDPETGERRNCLRTVRVLVERMR